MSTFTETVQRALGKKEERRYGVEGEIIFKFTFKFDPDPERVLPQDKLDALRAAIWEVDSAYPWKDKNDYGDSDFPSLGFVGSPEHQFHNLAIPELHVWFRVVSWQQYIRKSQQYAYEKYLAMLASELAKKELFGSESVRYNFRSYSTKTFKA